MCIDINLYLEMIPKESLHREYAHAGYPFCIHDSGDTDLLTINRNPRLLPDNIRIKHTQK
jgi:hypothetical protein